MICDLPFSFLCLGYNNNDNTAHSKYNIDVCRF